MILLMINPEDLQQLLTVNSISILGQFGIKSDKLDEEDLRVIDYVSDICVENIFDILK